MVFLSPILLTGLALASVPVIIHLLNRRRFRLVDWAPMKYLKLTIKKNRRRMRIEQFILLAVRTLAIVALILAVARPVLSATGLGSWLGARGRAAKVIVIDDSLSMGYQADRRSAFEAAKEAATQLVKSVGPQDSLTILTTSAPGSPLLRDAHLDDSSKATAAIAALQQSDARADWPAMFKVVDQHLANAPFPAKDVVLVTDLRREGWGNEVTETANRWASQSVEVKLIDVGTRQTANVSLVGFDQQDPVALPGQTVNLMATIRNDQATVPSAQALLTIGGESRPVILPDLAPGSTTRVPLTVRRDEPGQQPIQLKLPSDVLPADDGRWLNLNVRPNLQVTLVDGEPGARPFEGETDFLALSFAVGGVPWRVTKQSDSEWVGTRVGGVGETDVIVLANVASLSPERVKELEELVRGGVGLMIFAGEQVDPQLYNDRLYKDGNGLLPARLEKIADDPVTGLVVESLDDSPLLPLSKIDPGALGRIVAKKFMIAETPLPLPPGEASGNSDRPRAGRGEGARQSEPRRLDRSLSAPSASTTRPHPNPLPEGEGTSARQVRVLAKWNDSESHPAVIEKRFGKGRVLLWTVTADRAWSDWPVDPTYVLGVRSAAIAVARPDGQENMVNAGEPIRHRLATGESTVADARVLVPGASEPQVAAVEKTDAGTILVHPRTTQSGVYTLKWKDNTGAERSHVITVNPNKAESDLRPVTESELADLMGSLSVSVIHYTGGETSLTGQGREIWKTLAMTLLALAAVESVLAMWVGRER
jgi:hypothetical protein